MSVMRWLWTMRHLPDRARYRLARRLPDRVLYWCVVEARVRFRVGIDESVATLVNRSRFGLKG